MNARVAACAVICASSQTAPSSRTNIEGYGVSTLRCDRYPGDGLKLEQLGPFPKTHGSNSGFIQLTALGSASKGTMYRGITMSEPIKSQSISRRRLFWLAAIAAAVAAPANMLSTSDARAQQSDQAPAAEPTTPKTKEKKKKKKTGATTAPGSSPPAPPKQQ